MKSGIPPLRLSTWQSGCVPAAHTGMAWIDFLYLVSQHRSEAAVTGTSAQEAPAQPGLWLCAWVAASSLLSVPELATPAAVSPPSCRERFCQAERPRMLTHASVPAAPTSEKLTCWALQQTGVLASVVLGRECFNLVRAMTVHLFNIASLWLTGVQPYCAYNGAPAGGWQLPHRVLRE